MREIPSATMRVYDDMIHMDWMEREESRKEEKEKEEDKWNMIWRMDGKVYDSDKTIERWLHFIG